nr:hypothetical protein [uncultured Cohaesibacter sp.]
MIEAPYDLLTIGNVVYSFDEDSLLVTAGFRDGQRGDDAPIIENRQEPLEWLWQWSFWLDRETDPLQKLPEELTARSVLLALYDYGAPASLSKLAKMNRLSITTMPKLPWFANLASRMRWVPRKFRASQAKKIHAYRQTMAQWLDKEIDLWEDLRERAAVEQQVEGPFEAYLGYLRQKIEAGVFSVEVQSAFHALLRSVSPHIEIVELKGSESENFILLLKIHDDHEEFSGPRHQPSNALDRLIVLDGRMVAEQRVKEIGYRIAILVSEMLQMMHCRRNQVAMAFILSHHHSSKPVFALTFKATQFLTYRSSILSSINLRGVPDLPICRYLKLDDV